jgi:hypothetical protein
VRAVGTATKQCDLSPASGRRELSQHVACERRIHVKVLNLAINNRPAAAIA